MSSSRQQGSAPHDGSANVAPGARGFATLLFQALVALSLKLNVKLDCKINAFLDSDGRPVTHLDLGTSGSMKGQFSH